MNEVTRILQALDQGEPRAAEELLPLVYEEFRRLAALRMANEPPGQTLQPTALVHEAWLRLVGHGGQEWANSRHFFAAAAEAMRRILVERARRRARQRHGGGWVRVDLEGLDVADGADDGAVLFVGEALERLAAQDPECAELVKMRFFAGLPNEEAARLLGMSDRTAKRNWAYARAWLSREIQRLRSDGAA